MSITLNHTIVPKKDKEAAAHFCARIFGVNYYGPMSHFAPVRVNNTDSFELHHCGFHIGDSEFDTILQRVQEARIPYVSEPRSLESGQLNSRKEPLARTVGV